jgi:hypothetical protein
VDPLGNIAELAEKGLQRGLFAPIAQPVNGGIKKA